MENIQLNRAVTRVEQDDGGVVVWSQTASGDQANVIMKIKCIPNIL